MLGFKYYYFRVFNVWMGLGIEINGCVYYKKRDN